MHSSQAQFDSIIRLYQEGKLDDALALVNEAIVTFGASAALLNVAGACAIRLGRTELAEKYLSDAVVVSPNDISILNNLGILYKQLNRLGDAERVYRRLLAIRPDHAEAFNNLGNVLVGLGRQEEAESAYRKAFSVQPEYATAYANLGNLLHQQKRYAEAEEAYEKSLSLDPGAAETHRSLGKHLHETRRFEQAVFAYRLALSIRPHDAQTHLDLGNTLFQLQRHSEAEEAYRQALRLNNNFAQAWNSLGVLLMQLGRFEEADVALKNALKSQPGYAEAYANLGTLFKSLRLYAEALACFEAAAESRQDYANAIGQAEHLNRFLCNWASVIPLDRRIGELLHSQAGTGIPPFITLAIPSMSPEQQYKCGALFANAACGTVLTHEPVYQEASWQHRSRLRIGYLSADFHAHATSYLLAGVLEHHDKDAFEVTLYSYGPTTGDNTHSRIRRACTQFRDIRTVSDREAAEIIHADGIDLLVDLKGFTKDSRPVISAWRPAPVLVSWLGYPGTLGNSRLADYIIGDPVVTPVEHGHHFSELIAQMPHTYQPNDRTRIIGVTPNRREAGLPETGFVFCCFNQSYKITPEVFDLWCRILLAVPNSVLWLLKPHEDAVANLRREATARGVEADRLIFAPTLPLEQHLGRLQLANIALDTFPYTSHTTASDALWVGTPVVTRIGETFASRVAASLLHAAGLPELVTYGDEDYVSLVAQLALDRGRLSALRKRLIDQKLRIPLFDTEKFTRDLEHLYRRMWNQHLQGRHAPILADARTR